MAFERDIPVEVYAVILKNDGISARKITARLNANRLLVDKAIRKLKRIGLIGYSGSWKVIRNNMESK